MCWPIGNDKLKNHAILGIVPYCLCTLYLVYRALFQYCLLLGLFQKLSSGGGPQAPFCPVGGGCFVDNVSEGWGISLTIWSRGGGGVNLSWGVKAYLVHSGACPGGGIWCTELSWGSGSSDSHVCPGCGGSEKKSGPPQDNFWNSP